MEKITTHKSGFFYFSTVYDSLQIENLLVRANVFNETISDLPILPELASKLESDIMYSSISGTAAIEGNPITKEDAERIAGGEEMSSYTPKHRQEILNLQKAYDLLSQIKPSETPFVLTEKLVCLFHQIITSNIPDEHNRPGKYRDGLVRVGDKAHGGIYTPPKIIADIRSLMNVFIKWTNSEKVISLDPFIRAALAHYYFCIIHPFWDGNGRTGRLIEAALLQSANIKYVPRELSNYYYKNVDEYYISFSKSIKLKKDITPFLKFSLEASVQSFTNIKESIVYFIRKFTLRDYYRYLRREKAVTSRQLQLLNLLLDNPESFSLKSLNEKRIFSILYRRVSTQTARRDLRKLESMNLLELTDKNIYSLNFRVLG